jgi:hypothetical protein
MSELEPKFKVGDLVAFKNELFEEDECFRSLLAHYPEMHQHKGKLLRISGRCLDYDSSEMTYLTEETGFMSLYESWLVFITKGHTHITIFEEAKFKVGDWVTLNEDFQAINFDAESSIWKRQFMKVKDLNWSFTQISYSVNENSILWPENWLKKVE